jgi:hypothetical protein
MFLCCDHVIHIILGGLMKITQEFSHDRRSVSRSMFEQLDAQSGSNLCYSFSCSERLKCVTLCPMSCLPHDKCRPMWDYLPTHFGREYEAGRGSGLFLRNEVISEQLHNPVGDAFLSGEWSK